MRVFASIFLAVSSAFAYQITYPGGSQGWNTSGPNYLEWDRVDTDPLTFAAFLTNEGTAYSQVLNADVDGTVGVAVCSPPSGGWPSGSSFRVNIVEDPEQLSSLLAQSSEFDITAVASNGSTTTATSTSSDTSTTPTGVSAATFGADAHAGLLTAVAALTAFVATLF